MRHAFRKLSKALENDNRSESVKRLVTMLRDDALDFHSIVSNELTLHPENEERTSLDLLQSLRISLMSQTLLLTSQIPSFSARDNLSPEILISSALIGLYISLSKKPNNSPAPSSISNIF